MADVLREFLVKVGFSVDAVSERKLDDSITRQEKRIREADKVATAANQNIARQSNEMRGSMAAGITALAASAVAVSALATKAVAGFAAGMEQLNYASQRTKTSAANLKAFQYAASQLGSTAEEAIGSLEAFGEKMRSAPGYEGMVKNLGVETRDAKGNLKDVGQSFAELGEVFSKMPEFQAKAYAGAMGIGDHLLAALRNPEFKRLMADKRSMFERVGLDPNQAKRDGADFMQTWRRMWSAIEVVAEKVESSLLKSIGGSVAKFTTWLLSNSDRIATAVIRIGETLVSWADKVSDLFAAFEKLDPKTKDFLIKIGALVAALVLLNSGPLGAILAITAALAAFLDEGKLKRLQDMWEAFDKLATKLTGTDGLTVAFGALATVLALRVVTQLTSVLGLLTSINALKLSPWLLGLLGVTGLAAVAHSEGILNSGDGSRSVGERVLRTLDPGAADRRYGKTPEDIAGAAKDPRNLYQRWAPKILGGKDAPGAGGGTEAAQPGASGKYRPVYKLGDADLDDEVVNTIAGEVSTKNAAGVDAVINNMMNRVGSKGWGPSGNLKEVARAPGPQYEGYRRAKADEAEFIRSRIREIASGSVPDNTEGSNSFRGEYYYRGKGANRTWARTSKIGPNIGGNRYGFVSGTPNGPYGSYAEPKADPAPVAAPEITKAIPKLEGALQNFSDRFNDSWGAGNSSRPRDGSPLGSWSNPSSSSTTTNSLAPVTNIRVDGSKDPVETGKQVGTVMGRQHADLLRNLQGNTA